MENPIFTHRSIRKYKKDPIPQDILQRVLEAGVRASNTGNMQVYSLIVTTDESIKEQLDPCHF
ncbi:MAG: nitroreductase family protein, partial [Rikenellaceae bacterium]|nr:nitroreductase family protein [Rikenellaceae bacterium]